MRSSEKRCSLISHVRFVADNIHLLIAGMSQNKVHEVFGLNFDVQRAISNGFAPNMTVRALDRLAAVAEIGIGELFLDSNSTDDYTAWYAESHAQYFSGNISALLAERRWSLATLSKATGISDSTLKNYFRSDTLPRLETLQTIADTMGIEVADLFLPPEGGVTNDERIYH